MPSRGSGHSKETSGANRSLLRPGRSGALMPYRGVGGRV